MSDDPMQPVRVGQRIKLLAMADDPDPIPVGTEGVVTGVTYFPASNDWQVEVEWVGVNRSLSLIYPKDCFSIQD
ncbi:hypothetical protein A3709_20380 [Halioglobus sp. HI00S01]|uniref:DUF4314 domain-containing protein n=1 Tax=Halioglobus sp. HI00S01 TaxID=1822214 RepID=UPI0007C2A80D|nr:DUF4314 domain-containing protein [Halioglobus sp. HI00S01]KZX57971.1 hypothetical protein A3709_20380 [Halioglobus sp. HI00S01]